ncbi:MAG: NAD(P)/FAD-dependent oxidoreductase [Flavobacteriales bacterium]|jgi:sulfide:quinone oxidoreductase|nr:NAD(P)/FAD-dependent oxidoreductase [Flavobacteriales bacterium]MBP7450201.1 NAD(P)/FAD-dependent oxidoreductase [Flavobacteriales bacterium]
MAQKHYDVLIIGGGTGGIMTAAQLRRKDKKLRVAIIDPAKDHWYQPAWTLVAADAFNMKDTRRDEKSLIPTGVDLIVEHAASFEPEQNTVRTSEGKAYTYGHLVVCPGIKLDIDALPGLREALATDKVCSNYVDPEKTKRVMTAFQGGTAVFTQPSTPIKCGGAPQKAAYLADEFFRRKGVRDRTKLVFATPGSVIFGVEPFRFALEDVVRKKEIILKTFYNPVRIDPVKQEIHFKWSKPGDNLCVITEEHGLKEKVEGEGTIVMHYDMLHLAPPQSAPDFVKNSSLAYAEGPNKGWLEVDINTLQHKRFPNIFGLGDAAALPTAKTGAAIRKQAPVVVANILQRIKDGALANERYEGYSSCPLVTGYGKMLLAEFKYDNVRDSDPVLSKLFDTSKPLWSMWVLKKYMLPWMYWNRMMKGTM